MKNFPQLLILAFAAIIFASCATMTNGRYQEITIESNVPGALVELDGVELGYTPFRGEIRKGKTRLIKVSKPGYFAGDINVRRGVDRQPFISGNIGLGLVGGSPYFSAGYKENYVDYPKRRREYEERKSKGETEMSEMEPRNDAPAYIVTGVFAAIGVFGVLASIDMSTNAAWEYKPSSYYVQLKEIEQSHSDYSEELFIRYFATMNHSQIAIDASNNGEYAEALADIMERKMDKEAARQGINEALEKSKGDQIMFGDALMERFRRR